MDDLVKKNTTLAVTCGDWSIGLNQRETGFKKVLAQTTYFYNVPFDEGKSDIMKDLYDGKFVHLHEMPLDGRDDLATIAIDVSQTTTNP